jgi:hypothetical protein
MMGFAFCDVDRLAYDAFYFFAGNQSQHPRIELHFCPLHGMIKSIHLPTL